ncbi:LOW QUALITY PROTEIN: uncharacterized protein [Rutidosis leptorrhynchoides]|uniref:LOW QUALITY PROTEIN: uncharacterized protein n=1 Tax=Rutidosis leptorrhynchoides TaxID=125765 RepID=UPI003A990747
MVVLSRPRSSQKAAPKLSVPPPLNLPSLRKEHERFDSLGSGTGAAGGGVSGSGTRPTSSGIGWTKPVTVALQEKEGLAVGVHVADDGDQIPSRVIDKGNSSVYVPPSARSGVTGPVVSSFPLVEKVSVLRGEDFPSLQAALPVVSAPAQKHKDGGNQKHKQTENEEFSNEQNNASRLSSHVDMRPQLQSSRQGVGNRSNENFNDRNGSVGSYTFEKVRKQEEYFSGPLPLVRFNPRSDWADDERDTGHGFYDKSRDNGYSKTETFWDHDFDMPRPTVLPHKLTYNAFSRTGPRDNETGKSSSSEVSKAGPYGRDTRIPSADGREGHSWRASSLVKGGLGTHELPNDRNVGSARPTTLNSENESKYNAPIPFRDNSQNDFGRRDVGYGQRGRQAWNNNVDSQERYGSEQHNRYRGNTSQNGQVSKGLPFSDPILNFGREKRQFSKNEKPYVEDPFGATGFDACDPFSGALVGLVKKKKDVLKQTDFHDPARDSFEAELERVQKMQEQERQRAVEEQERALEQARREEEERVRFVREQEERQRRVEEEAREASWRAQQENLEASRRAEELRISREEEKRRNMLEEERRKQAAKQKLLELEERIAKRQAEGVRGGSNSSVIVDDKIPGTSKVADLGEWEDGERMVERITTSASSDSSGLNRPYHMGSGPHFSTDGTSASMDRGKPVNSWRRDVFDNGITSTLPGQDLENDHHSPRKDFFGGPGFMGPRPFYKGGMHEPQMDDFPHFKGQRWNVPGYGEPYNRNMEFAQFNENLEEKYGEIGWGQGHSRGNSYPLYPERQYQSPEADGLYSIGRSRYRQPRVLPPPMSSMQRPPHRVENCGPSTFLENEMRYNHVPNNEPTLQRGCDSQSSLSVTSPPDSPVHLSHDDLDESGDSSVLLTAGDVRGVDGQQIDPVGISTESGKENMMTGTSSVDDDEGWAIENNDQLQQQEEYDEDEEGYGEKDEGHEVDDDNIDLTRELEDLQLEDKEDNLILGFNEGVEVGMPNDEFERSSRNEDTTFQIQEMSTGTEGEHGSYNRICSDEQNLESLNSPATACVDDSSGIFEEAEKVMQHLVMQSNTTPTDQVDVDPTQHQVSSTSPTVVSTVSAPSQSEAPVKLQFGLFTGPSLIPSPVPAIQIGSIQLQLHPQVGPSVGHMHPSQPPLFQFGQLRYPSPISQGLLPLATQSMSYVLPTAQASFPLNQNPGGPLRAALGQDAPGRNLMKNGPGPIQRNSDILKSMPARERPEGSVTSQQTRVDVPHTHDDKNWSESGTEANQGLYIGRNSKSEAQFPAGAASAHTFSKGKHMGWSKGQSLTSGGRNKKYVFAVKNSGSRSSMSSSETTRIESITNQRRPRRQRTEFRVRENADKRQATSFDSSRNLGSDDALNGNGTNGRAGASYMRNGARKIVWWNRSSKQISESEGTSSLPDNSQDVDAGSRAVKGSGKESQTKSRNLPSGDGHLKRNICSEEDVDTSLQSGIVRVFEQPGIEAPSDEDDFIQVRSKRQMLNDRREQREKEIKAKSRVSKMPRKSRPSSQSVGGSSNKLFPSVGGDTANGICSDFVATDGRSSIGKIEASSGFSNSTLSQPLAPIGTPAVKIEPQADMRTQPIKSHPTSSLSVVSGGGGKSLSSGLAFESNSKVLDNVQTSLGAWGNPRINQQVMALTQTQLDEAMKPAQFDSRASMGDQSTSIGEPVMPSSSILTKNMSLSSSASPVNSLLAGEKIQFGAVTSPTILPTSPSRSDIQISHNMPASGNDCFFENEKQPNEACVNLEECEAEAAASAVAVAAISSDETVGNGMGTCSVTVADTKSYGGANVNAGVADDHKSSSHSRGEESLSVALPADLSVETPPISLWPPLPSPQNSSSQMISHFPGGPPSHFPFYDMNPMLGGPIFAFGPHDESRPGQSMSQKSVPPSSGPPGTWHSGVDSFYGPPSGFTGPFISTPGGIQGVQGPPHMVVYNHFAPVGQFGQVGLSFMGTTYIPSGKQPDWKHTPAAASSAMGGGDGDMKNSNMVPPPHTNMGAPIQHLAPGSPLLPMPSPLAMFDVSPFQSSPDMSVQARWSNAVPPLQSMPMSMPFPQQAESTLPSQFSHGSTQADPPITASRFPTESRTVPSSEHNRNFPVMTANSTISQLPDELGLVDSSSSSAGGANSSSASNVIDVGKTVVIPENARNNNRTTGRSTNSSSFKPQSSSQQNNMASQQQYGNNYQRGPSFSQKGNSGSDWSHHRRTGFQGRNQPLGSDKGFGPSKMKQIYVAKQQPATNIATTTTGTTTTSS